MKFEDILSEFNIPTAPTGHEHVREGWVQFDCPFCSKGGHRWRMGYSKERGFVNCWACGSHPLVTTIIELTGLSYRKAKKLLGTLETISFKEESKPLGRLVIPPGVNRLHPAHKQYLKSRGFNWREIEQVWKICGIAISSRLSWRIWIPIYYRGEIVSWTTRSISSSKKITRYISASKDEEVISHKELLYGEDFARHAIIINEGPLNAWKIGPGAVATFGSGYSIKQLERMAKYPVRAICFDNEPEAQRQAKKLVNDLSVFPGDTYNIVLDKKDAAEESAETIKRLRKEILE